MPSSQLFTPCHHPCTSCYVHRLHQYTMLFSSQDVSCCSLQVYKSRTMSKLPFVKFTVIPEKLDSLPCRMPAPPSSIQPIPHDVLTLPREDRIRLAIAAIQESGTKPNGDPCY